MPKWTGPQQQAIDAKGKLTVVSARAGSGKTAVLAQRATGILADETNPVSADRLLIVTFSNASAKEFRRRIEAGLDEMIRNRPKNTYLRAQKAALQKADISTIHSFCIKLVRENFESLGIPYDFTIADDAQASRLHNLAINSAMDYGYTDPDFVRLSSFYGRSSSDMRIRDFLRQMDFFFSRLPHPTATAKALVDRYNRRSDMKQTGAYARVIRSIKAQADYMVYLARRMADIYESADFEGYEQGIESAARWAESVREAAFSEDIPTLHRLTASGGPSLGRAKPATEMSKTIKDSIYADMLGAAKEIRRLTEYLDNEKYLKDIRDTADFARALFKVYGRYQEVLAEVKKDRKLFEFSDFEHFALSLLQNEDGSPTNLSLQLREHYEYIMEDEFQDTSFVQDAIFTMIAKENGSNLYVVGDVKQSIYGFRKASPEIFLSKRGLELVNPATRQTIYLPHNFRSEYPVIQGVNAIFSRLMSSAVGGVEYGVTEALATLKEPVCEKGVILRIYPENERAATARQIDKMIKEGYTITENGGQRPVRAGDFCILMRSSGKFARYKLELENLGYKVAVRDEEPILKKTENEGIISFLKAVSNPMQEVHLIACMFGEMFGFTLDEILQIRLCAEGENLYKALALSSNPKAALLLDTLKDARYAAGVYSADKLIDYICKKTGYYQKLAFAADGGEKRENIRLFIAFAKSWAKTHGNDLAAFIRWIDMYVRQDKSSNRDVKSSPDAVSIMTMHHSKGLEFPVCFVTELGTRFNRQDLSRKLMLDTELGIGMYANSKFGYNRSTLNIRGIREKTDDVMAGEEMRLLYVAFTRAKNLLVLSRSYNRGFSYSGVQKAIACTDKFPHPAFLKGRSNPASWVISALSKHSAFGRDAPDPELEKFIDVEFALPPEDMLMRQREAGHRPVEADTDRILDNFAYTYPHAARTKLPVKMTVSEIAKSVPITLATPDFARENKYTGAQRGTATHRFLRQADILLARMDLESELESLKNRGLVDEKLLNLRAIKRFLEGDVATMIINSENVYREKDFLVPYSAASALGDDEYLGDEVLIQGIMDCVLENGDEITIIDYKTDYVQDMDTLMKRYQKQLELYRHGARLLFKKDNVKCLLYSFHLNEYVIF